MLFRSPQALRHTYLPIAIERFRSNGPGAREVWAHAVRRSAQDDPQTVTIDIAVYREDGSRAATLEGLSLRQLSAQALAPGAAQGRPDWLYLLQWVEQPQLKGPPAERTPDGPSAWLILADQGEGQKYLGEKLEAIRAMKKIKGKAAVYVCENFTCKAPVTDAAKLRKSLSR